MKSMFSDVLISYNRTFYSIMSS